MYVNLFCKTFHKLISSEKGHFGTREQVERSFKAFALFLMHMIFCDPFDLELIYYIVT